MKKIALFLAVALCSVAASAQSIAKNELKQLQAFLAQPAQEAATNAEALKVTDTKNLAAIEGVTVENGHVTAIDFKGKKLAGTLDLSGFPALTKVDVSRNRLTSLSLANDPALTSVNASRNRISEFDMSGCP